MSLRIQTPSKVDLGLVIAIIDLADSCGSSGGNGKVVAGQTSCYTPMVYDLDPRTSYAFGKYYGNGYIYSAYTGSYYTIFI